MSSFACFPKRWPRFKKMSVGQDKLTTAQLNTCDRESFVARLGFVFEHSPWIAQAAWDHRPFADAGAVYAGMVSVLRTAPEAAQLEVIAAHPDLAGRVAREGRLTSASSGEQTVAGLDRLSADEIARFDALNTAYRARFGFPFVICAREHTKTSILAALARRLENDRTTEISSALAEIVSIARLRLQDVLTA